MAQHSVDEQIEILSRGCEQVFKVDELRRKIAASQASGRPLRVKLGMDPTAPDLTLGHAVVLGKMRQFQDLGHKAVLIIGDYTAMIGDPSGRAKTRPMLSTEDVDRNAKTYFEQAGRILDVSEEKLEIRRNSEWLAPMNFADCLRLASQMTVARMLERDTFAKRHKAGTEIYIHEFMYPLMQGWDSVRIEADVELGGSDQTFNNLVGRDLQKNAGQEPQVVVITPLLVGLDGVEKMSKSLGNYVGVTESAPDMFGKIMSIPDELMLNYFTLLTTRPLDEARDLIDPARHNLRDAKVLLAKDIVTRFHNHEEADRAETEFFRIHGAGKGGLPDEIDDCAIPAEFLKDGGVPIVKLVVHCGFAASNGEARRLIAERGVRLNGEPVDDANAALPVKSGDIIQRGKRKFLRLVLEG